MQQITYVITDDIDGSPNASTFRFSVDGKDYEIDLVEENKVAFIEMLQPYIAVARIAMSETMKKKIAAREKYHAQSKRRR